MTASELGLLSSTAALVPSTPSIDDTFEPEAASVPSTPAIDDTFEPEDSILVILRVKEVYSYTIPSFSAITVKLRHVVVANDNSSGLISHNQPTLDVFFREDPVLTSVCVPTKVRVVKACCVPVSLVSINKQL